MSCLIRHVDYTKLWEVDHVIKHSLGWNVVGKGHWVLADLD